VTSAKYDALARYVAALHDDEVEMVCDEVCEGAAQALAQPVIWSARSGAWVADPQLGATSRRSRPT
jgi:hypothetical protein